MKFVEESLEDQPYLQYPQSRHQYPQSRHWSHKSVMMGKTKADPNPPRETNALIADTDVFKSSSYQRNTPNLWCDHCNRSRHTRETCRKLHGKPAHLKNGKSGPKSVPTTHEAKKSLPNQDQVEELIGLLKSNSLSSIPNASLAQTRMGSHCGVGLPFCAPCQGCQDQDLAKDREGTVKS
ncbi:hypothetical protein KIW84_066587 [Lathyrus oleraceus]|uniref:Uncharacterized protein n=1 Tax=Pisum sativum TaxID=3888 RepID=A0A9D4WG65_PEA|nr:hypothetical protein KIW84_066587 [Pisum sativum]